MLHAAINYFRLPSRGWRFKLYTNFRLRYRWASIVGILALLVSKAAHASPATFEVGQAALPATTGNSFTRVNFQTPFAAGTTPNVFPMTTLDGADPCTLRIRNVDASGFDAVCLEPQNEDGSHPGMLVEYIAISDGGASIPLSGGGTAEFESACTNINNQVYGPNCDNCSGAQSSTGINFSNAYGAAPAVLTQVQTTNNTLVGGDPVFIDTAVTGLNSNGFNLSLDQLEAGVGPLNSTERVCYLAAARDGCQSLDFSSLGGPATPVTFNAVHGGNVDGFDNGCSAGEGANFTAGCFSSTPIAIADQRTRNGNNGLVLRRCSVNASQILLTADEDQVSDNERSHIDESVSAFAFSQVFTTPVTLNQASVSKIGRRALFAWQTSAESFHVGFHLWGEIEGEWIQLNRRLIPGGAPAAAGVREYSRSLRLSKEQQESIQRFGISTIDSAGYEEFYGPFEAEQEYGELAINEAVDWTQVRSQLTQKLRAAGLVQKNGVWRETRDKVRKRLTQQEYGIGSGAINFTVHHAGPQRISGAAILAAMPEWRDIQLDQLAMTLKGTAVPRKIYSNDSKLDEQDTLVFAAKKPSGPDAIYLRNYTYQLRLDENLAISAPQRAAANTESTSDSPTTIGIEARELTSAKAYSAALNNGDPYYDAQLFSLGNAVSKVYGFTLDNNVALGHGSAQSVAIDVTLFGSIDFPEPEDDHHVQIRVNGELLDDIYFDGVKEYVAQISVPADLLQIGENDITITLPGDTGYSADVVLIDKIQLSLPVTLSGHSEYTFAPHAQAKAFAVSVEAELAPIEVFAWQPSGALEVLEAAKDSTHGSLQFAAAAVQADVRYTVSSVAALPKITELFITAPQLLHEVDAELLIITHPLFLGDRLDEFVAFKRNEGVSVTVVNWLEIVDTYGFGNPLPTAINRFLLAANQHAPVRNLLLVGGHTWDYLGLSGQATVNLLPTHYRPVGLFGFTPTDNVFADLDADNLPDFAIGRWPVRELSDLDHIVAKTLKWHTKVAQEQYQDALVISQQNDGRGLSFDDQVEGHLALPMRQDPSFGSLSKVSMQALIEAGDESPVATARQMIRDGINRGIDTISFAGHASSAAWGPRSVVNTQFIQDLQNTENPLLVMPLACYTTYYESPSINTLAHQWMFSGKQGAAAVHGASVLGEYRENAVFAERYLRAAGKASTLGGAILDAKRSLSGANQMLHNWALLGDPTLPLH